MKNKITNLYIAFGLFLLSAITGVFAFRYFESYSWVDALYMTSITVSTVGFGALKEISDAGKIFVSVYIFFNLCILAFVVSVFSRYLFEGELKQLFSNYMIDKEIKKMKGHVIVCGYGRNGYRACQELEREGFQFVIVDIEEEPLSKAIAENKNLKYFIGDATDEATLKAVNIENASALITAMPDDAINVFVTLTARELNKKINIIARATLDSSISKLYTAGASKVVMPDNIGGRYMADLVTKPEVIQFLDKLTGIDGDLELINIKLESLKSDFQNITIRELAARAQTGVNVLGLKNLKEEYVFNPPLETIIGNEGVLMILGSFEETRKFKKIYLN